MRTLFFLGGASLLSGLEARAHFGVAAKDAHLLASPRLVAHGVGVVPWASTTVIETKLRKKSSLAHLAGIIGPSLAVIARHGPFERVVLADLTAPMCFTAMATRPADVVVVDDGLSTAAFASARRRGPVGGAGLLLDPPRVTYFSAFTTDGRTGDAVVVNDYRNLRSQLFLRPTRNEAWIVGQPVAENGMLARDVYREAVVDAVAAVGAGGVYVAHPNESDAEVAAMTRGIDVEVRRFPVPLELEALHRGPPRAVVGFFSAALPQLSLLFGATVPVTAVRIAPGRFLRANDVVERAYRELDAVALRVGGLRLIG